MLPVASYKMRVTIYCTSYELLFTARFASYFLQTSYEFLFIAPVRVTFYIRVTSNYLLHTNYKLIFTYDLRVTICCTSYELNLSYELRVTIARVGIVMLIM